MLSRLLKRKPPPQTPKQAIADKIVTELKDSIAFKKSIGLIDTIIENENFNNGDQWPAPTQATKDYPRPVLNIVKRITKSKTAAVLQEPPTFTFMAKEGTPEDGVAQFDEEGAKLFTEAAKNTWENVKMPKILKRTVELSQKQGSSFKHWFWDQTIIGGSFERGNVFIGDINGEVLGADKVHLGNPNEKDIQKQPWVKIVGKIAAKEFYDAYADSAAKLGLDVNEVKPDKEDDKLPLDITKKAKGEYITVIHHYEKIYEGIKCYVHYKVVADGKLVRHESPLYEGDLYPISDYVWDEREDHAYGLSEVEGIIPNQKQINRMLATYLFALINTGIPKIAYNESYVNLKDISNNMPGALVRDNSPGLNGWRYVQPTSMPGDIPNILEQLTTMSKDLAGANEAFLGEAAPQNASAIMMLQKQANAPVQEMRDRLFDSTEADIKIWELFYKRFYAEARLIKLAGNNMDGYAWFRGTDYYDLKLAIKVEAGGGSAYSEALMMSELKELKADGTITKEEYLEFAPKTVFPFAQQVLDRRKQQQQMMMQQHAMMQQQGMMGQGPIMDAPLVPLQ